MFSFKGGGEGVAFGMLQIKKGTSYILLNVNRISSCTKFLNDID